MWLDKFQRFFLEYKVCLLFALLYLWGIFFWEDRVFIVASSEKIVSYICVKVISYCTLAGLFIFFYRGIKKDGCERKMIKASALYVVILTVLFFMRHDMVLVGDELNIYNEAIRYNIYPYHFTYFTGLYYCVSLTLFPFMMGPMVLKIILQSIVVGYCCYKLKSKWLVYIMFLTPVTISEALMLHRMQIYALLYLVFVIKVFYDSKENIIDKSRQFCIMSAICAVLSIWRSEGIALMFTGLPLLFLVYKYRIQNLKVILWVYVLIVSAILLPHVMYSNQGISSPYAKIATSYAAWTTHLPRYGLDYDKYPMQKDKIEAVISIDAVNKINIDLGDNNFDDVYIAFKPQYIGIKHATPEEWKEYMEAMNYIILHEPEIFLKTRIAAWVYTANNGVALNVNSKNPVTRILFSLWTLCVSIVVSDR